MNFFSQFLAAAYISIVNYDQMVGDKPRQPAHEIFSTKPRFGQFKSRPLRFKEAGVGRRQRRLPPPPPKSGYFTAIGSCSVKTVADRQRHAAYHNKQ